jgi:hypothetical protein
MVKTVIVEFDDLEHSHLLIEKDKSGRTWREVVRDGINCKKEVRKNEE